MTDTGMKTICLCEQIPKKAVTEKPGRIAERKALEMQQKNQIYKLLSDSDDEPAPEPTFKVSVHCIGFS